MALALDLLNLICTVDQNDMTDVTAGQPTEVRELDADDFRKEWGALMDNEPNVSYPWPFEWTQPKTLGGIVYAPLLEIINGWTVTFTVGAYGVNVVNANTNLSDVVVPAAGVGVNTQNSGGLIVTDTSGLTPSEAADLALALKLLRNRREQDPADGSVTVYDDDSSTPLLSGTAYEDIAGTQTYQGNGADRIDRLT